MRIHHLDCGPMHPPGGALMDGVSGGLFGRLTCHCLLIETDAHGLVLVDTGFGLRDTMHPWRRLSPAATVMLLPRFDPERTMLRQLARLGLSPRDVRHIVMTHLDFDHAGGLADFPDATVHVTEVEADAARRRRSVLDRMRYRPVQWGGTGRWRTYPERSGGRWFGFDAVTQLDGLPPEILMVALPGHTRGHAGVAIEGKPGWVLHAGDTYFNRAELHDPRGAAAAPSGARALEWAFAWNPTLAHANQARLRDLVAGGEASMAVFCTHDPVEYVAMAAWSGRNGREGVATRAA